ncbi:hypothetical protein AVEN_123736-1 [Araneus ventricosus]|uniref:Uncharacterized protein n=1 Tax=Araneus ventricosus TaxID=182803 RepID=A0A4Y2BJV0_ARAVE|nr:hypothetical protein AVEN_123736-1 [Araneus ventricosus]
MHIREGIKVFFSVFPSRFATERGCFGWDLAILSCGRMAGMAPELAPPLSASAPHWREGIWPRWVWHAPGPLARWFFDGIGSRTWGSPTRRPGSCHQATAAPVYRKTP